MASTTNDTPERSKDTITCMSNIKRWWSKRRKRTKIIIFVVIVFLVAAAVITPILVTIHANGAPAPHAPFAGKSGGDSDIVS